MSTNAVILPEPSAILPKLLSDRDLLLAHIDTLSGADSVEGVNALNVALTRAATLVNQVEAYRKAYTAPLDAFKKLCMRQQEEALAPLEEAVSAIKQELSTYATRVKEDLRKREEIRQVAEQTKTVATVGSRHVTPALVPMAPAPEVAKVHTRKVARLVVTDMSMIPPIYFELNEAKLLAFLRESPVNAVLGAHYVMDDVVVTGRAS
jgi:hypothetical protein